MKIIACILLLGMVLPVLAATPASESYYGNPNPKHLSAVERHHLPQAREKARWKNPSYAWTDVNFILRHFPNHPDALMLAIDLSFKSNDMRHVKELFEKAVLFDPEPAAPWVIYGLFYHRHGQLSEAVKRYLEALKRDPDLAEAHYNLGLAYFKLKQYEAANQAAQKAYALGYPLPGLRRQLKRVDKWQPASEMAADKP